MDKNLLQKYTGRHEGELLDSTILELETEDLRAFGWLRGTRDRCPMLELRQRTGNALAVGYGWIERVEYDPSTGIVLFVPGKPIKIIGRNLNTEVRPMVRLFEGITRHRVSWIREADQASALSAKDDDCIVETIQWG